MSAHSPILKMKEQPIEDLDTYRKLLRGYRVKADGDDGLERYAGDDILVDAEELLEHGDFLEEKLAIKVCSAIAPKSSASGLIGHDRRSVSRSLNKTTKFWSVGC